jgi:hypothetical protein
MKFLSLGFLIFGVYAGTAIAQSERTINSNNMTPGTSVPVNPNDPVQRVNQKDDSAVRLPGKSTEIAPDAGSAPHKRKHSPKKLSKKQQQEQELFPNERAPRIDTNSADHE